MERRKRRTSKSRRISLSGTNTDGGGRIRYKYGEEIGKEESELEARKDKASEKEKSWSLLEMKKSEFRDNLIQKKLTDRLVQLPEREKEKYRREEKKRRMELNEAKENFWKWRSKQKRGEKEDRKSIGEESGEERYREENRATGVSNTGCHNMSIRKKKLMDTAASVVVSSWGKESGQPPSNISS